MDCGPSVVEAALLIKVHLADNQGGPDVTWEAILSQLLVPPGTGLVNTALGQLCRSGFMRPCQVPDCLPLQGSQGVVARPESCLPGRQTYDVAVLQQRRSIEDYSGRPDNLLADALSRQAALQ